MTRQTTTFICPTQPPPRFSLRVATDPTKSILGCGQRFDAEPDVEGLVDCPHCGIWFRASEPGVIAAAATVPTTAAPADTEPTAQQLRRLLQDVQSMMLEQRDDNDERIADGNPELFNEVSEMLGFVDAAQFSSGDVTFRRTR